jgi:hypothetical protein
MTKERPYFDPDHPLVFPIEEINGERYLVHCVEHQQVLPKAGEEETEQMRKVKLEIQTLCHSFRIKAENVSSGYCKVCFHKTMQKYEEDENLQHVLSIAVNPEGDD